MFRLPHLPATLAYFTLNALASAQIISDSQTREQPDGCLLGPLQGGPPPYFLFRDMEDYSYLSKPNKNHDLFDPIKYVALNAKGDDYLSFGGEVRERYEYWSRENFGLTPAQQNNYWLERIMLHAGLHLSPDFTLFTQFSSTLEAGREGGPRPVDKDPARLHQAYLDWTFFRDGDDRAAIRIGRQELAYGIGRVLDPREGPNTRISFDGVKSILHVDKWEIDAFGTRPVETNAFHSDNPDPHSKLWGVYATHDNWFWEISGLDFYYLGSSRDSAPYFSGVADDVRHTLGARLHGREGDFDYDIEGGYQLGSFGSSDVSAWFSSNEVGYAFSQTFGTPYLALKADVFSGNNDVGGSENNTFYTLYGRGNYYSEPSPIGQQNIIALHPQLDWYPTKTFSVTASPIFYWRESENDGIYNFPGFPSVPGNSIQGRFVGTELYLETNWQLNQHLVYTVSYDHLIKGDFLNSVPGAKDSDFFATWFTFKF